MMTQRHPYIREFAERADIKKYPPYILKHLGEEPGEIIIPDLHANALKLIWLMILLDMVELSEEHYLKREN
jgi:hypothetical protein